MYASCDNMIREDTGFDISQDSLLLIGITVYQQKQKFAVRFVLNSYQLCCQAKTLSSKRKICHIKELSYINSLVLILPLHDCS